MDIAALRERLASKQGPQYWRSLEELAETPEFQKFLEDEFPNRSTLLQLDRRQFLTLMGASLAMAGLSGCRYLPQEKIVPYVKEPEDRVLGRPQYYATVMPLSGDAIGLLVRDNEGRPTKVEGNPDHPNSLGATNAFAQASVLDLYDPDRAQTVLSNVRVANEISSWDAFLRDAITALATQRASGGAGLRILTETVISPTLRDQLDALRRQFPAAKWHQYEPMARDNAHNGAMLTFGRPVNTIYRFDKADRIVSLDADFLLTMPGSVRYARDFASRRRIRSKDIAPDQPANAAMNRLYVVESTPTITGAMADHREPVRASEVEGFARALASRLGVAGVTGTAAVPWLEALVADLNANRGRCVIVAGDHQPPAVHALAHAMNAALGAVGNTVVYTEPVVGEAVDQMASLKDLVSAMQAGQVQFLLIIGGNPVYNAPADLNFADQLSKVAFTAHLGLHNDETSALCKWHLPETHYLEAWSDARTFDGTAAIVQPLIQPLYDNKSAHEVIALLLGDPRSGYDIVRDYWRRQNPTANFDLFWEKTLNDGVIAGTAFATTTVTPNANLAAALPAPTPVPGPQEMELIFQPDPTLWDGRFANNGWLQELPKPLTKLVWDNAAFISPKTAETLGIFHKSEIEQNMQDQQPVLKLTYRGRELNVPAFVLPGHPDNAITLTLGYGRTRAGRVGNETGFNAYALRTSDAPWFGGGLTVGRTGDSYLLVATHHHNSVDMQGRDPVRLMTLEEFQHPGPEQEAEERENHPAVTLYNQTDVEERAMQRQYGGFGAYAWGMSIDNTTCIGCNACVIACQAENNIPVVGKDQVFAGREMQWLRIDRYFVGTDLERPRMVFQPIPCMHCELAPCEPVCPVGATTHSHEGLNQMVYNRCVGTRYCSNNCPYKVRRFNFLNYANDFSIPVIQLVHNPDVTVRSRGVMEKCSYCVQRINAARIEAKKANREIRDGEIQTACQQACPTRTITFGNIYDQNSQVAKLKSEPQDYSLLGDLNTRPRTTYLKKFENPNPDIKTVE